MVTASRAEKILRLVRELVQGSQALRATGDFTPAVAGNTFILLANAVFALDFYLTQEMQTGQDRQMNSGYILTFLTQSQSALCRLADQKTHLILRWPTPEDARVVYLDTQDESTPSIDLRRRWNRINNANSEAVEFPREVPNGRA